MYGILSIFLYNIILPIVKVKFQAKSQNTQVLSIKKVKRLLNFMLKTLHFAIFVKPPQQ
jgi:hypothetical protein